MSRRSGQPSKVLLPRFDSIGDLVLLHGLLEAAVARFPDTQFTLLVRPGVLGLSSLSTLPVRWQVVDIDPHACAPQPESVHSLRDCLAEGNWTDVWFTAYTGTWADIVVSQLLPAATQLKIGPPLVEAALPTRLAVVLRESGIDTGIPRLTTVPCGEEEHELLKYQRFWDTLRGRQADLPYPRLAVPEATARAVDEQLRKLKLEPGRYVSCFPFVGKAPYRSWPEDRYVDAVCYLEKQGLKTLLMGDKSESEAVHRISGEARKRGAAPRSWLGGARELGMCAGFLSRSCFYFGNDSGPMHICCALDVPVLAIFGGGTWPRFLPFGAGAIAFRRMPCYGCRWDCCFGDAPCIQNLPFELIQRMLSQQVQSRPRTDAALLSFKAESYPLETETVLKHAFDRHHELKTALGRMRENEERLVRQLRESDADRRVRLEVIENLEQRLAQSDADRQVRLEVIENLEKMLAQSDADRQVRLEVIENLEKMLARCDADRQVRLEVIEDLEQRLARCDADRQVRLEVIEDLEQRLGRCDVDRRTRLDVIEDLEKRLAQSDADRQVRLDVIEDLEKRLAQADMDRQVRLNVINDIQARLAQLDADNRALAEMIKDLQSRLEAQEELRRILEGELSETRKFDIRRFPLLRIYYSRRGPGAKDN